MEGVSVENATEWSHGFPYPRWEIIGSQIERQVPPDGWDSAWCDVARQWVGALCRPLGDGYAVHESANFVLVTMLGERHAKSFLQCAESALKRLLHALEGVASDEGCGKHVVLVFDEVERYYSYIAHFYPEGVYGLSGGQFIDAGYGHIALIPVRYFQTEGLLPLEFALAHELTHALLRHRPLPQWVEEGVAQVMEEMVVGQSRFQLDGEKAGKHRSYWRRHGLRDFWWGRGFSLPDEGQELSYGLAEILVRIITTDHPAEWRAFLNAADRDDAGEWAAMRHLGASLGDVAAQFLGSGEWAPSQGAGTANGLQASGHRYRWSPAGRRRRRRRWR